MRTSFLRFVVAAFMAFAVVGFIPSSYAQGRHNHQHGRTPQTSMTVSSNHYSFWLYVDDILQNELPVAAIMLERVPEGDHYIRVEMNDPEHHTIGQLICVDVTNCHFAVDKQLHLFGLTAAYGVIQPNIVTTLVTPQSHHGAIHWNGYHQDHVASIPHGANSIMVMNNIDFMHALDMIRNENFDNNRLETAKRVVDQHYLSLSQVDQICRLFEYDHNRLDFAKYAYSHCVEPEKYYMLYNLFTFDHNRQELDKFIQEQ